MFTDLQEPEFVEIKRYIDSVIDGEPIDFDKLLFPEIKTLLTLRNQAAKVGLTEARASEKLFCRKAIKPLFITVIVSYVCILLASDASAFKALSGISFITSSILLCFAWLKSH